MNSPRESLPHRRSISASAEGESVIVTMGRVRLALGVVGVPLRLVIGRREP